MLGEAVAQTLPGEDRVLQANRGLKILDQASGLRAQPTPTLHRARATCFARKGDETSAARERAAADRLRPTTVLDHYLAGREGYKRQDWKTALSEFEIVLRTQPDHFWSLCLGAIAAIQMNQPALAKLGLNACVKQEPRFAWLYMLRGFASCQAAVEARVTGKAPKIEDRSIEAAAEVQFDAADDDYRKALELLEVTPNDELRWVAMVNRALMRFQRGRLDEAVDDLEEAIRLDGRHYLAFANLAQVLQRQKKWDEAVARFTQAIRLKPGWSPLYRGRAAVEQARDEQTPEHRTKALGDLEQAIQYEKPDNLVLADDHTGRGELLRRDRRFEDALAACDAALTIAPDYAKAHRLRMKVLLELNRFDEVVRSCDGALARGQPWPGLYEVRGLARASQADYAGAIDDYSHALALRPGQSRLLSAAGWRTCSPIAPNRPCVISTRPCVWTPPTARRTAAVAWRWCSKATIARRPPRPRNRFASMPPQRHGPTMPPASTPRRRSRRPPKPKWKRAARRRPKRRSSPTRTAPWPWSSWRSSGPPPTAARRSGKTRWRPIRPCGRSAGGCGRSNLPQHRTVPR